MVVVVVVVVVVALPIYIYIYAFHCLFLVVGFLSFFICHAVLGQSHQPIVDVHLWKVQRDEQRFSKVSNQRERTVGGKNGGTVCSLSWESLIKTESEGRFGHLECI